MPSGYAQSVGVIGRVTTPFRSLSANRVPRNKPKHKADRTLAAPCTERCQRTSTASQYRDLVQTHVLRAWRHRDMQTLSS